MIYPMEDLLRRSVEAPHEFGRSKMRDVHWRSYRAAIQAGTEEADMTPSAAFGKMQAQRQDPYALHRFLEVMLAYAAGVIEEEGSK